MTTTAQLNAQALRNLPRVDDVIILAKNLTYDNNTTSFLGTPLADAILQDSAREIIEAYRISIKNGSIPDISIDSIAQEAVTLAHQKTIPTLRTVINATGIVLHTNLGRAPLAPQVAQHVKNIAENYSTLEYDLHTGKRGSRTAGIENMLAHITKAESACIVNNNAAAVLLTLSALCSRREIVVSRGELVEIGGSFRVPEVIAQGGAILREVGATNKTHAHDYVSAITENTGALLKVHTSNYRIVGFTHEVPLAEMAEIATSQNLISIYDLGGGALVDIPQAKDILHEPTIQEAVASGVDITCFSGDKLLGGPQCGIIIGKRALIKKLSSHPLYRALRADKLTLAALEGTLHMYSSPKKIPALAMLQSPLQELEDKAKTLLQEIRTVTLDHPTGISCTSHHTPKTKIAPSIQKVVGHSGGGALPSVKFESWAVVIPACGTLSANTLEHHLRHWRTPIIARINNDSIILDVRTIPADAFSEIALCLGSILPT